MIFLAATRLSPNIVSSVPVHDVYDSSWARYFFYFYSIYCILSFCHFPIAYVLDGFRSAARAASYTLGLLGLSHGVLEIWVSRKEFCTITVECICAIGSKGP
jgi:hypothetical protein